MLGSSRFDKPTALRPLGREERDLIVSLLSRVHSGRSVTMPIEAQVEDMPNGGMGRIRFTQPDPRLFGRELLRGEYLDRMECSSALPSMRTIMGICLSWISGR